jgi:hypothetical protein
MSDNAQPNTTVILNQGHPPYRFTIVGWPASFHDIEAACRREMAERRLGGQPIKLVRFDAVSKYRNGSPGTIELSMTIEVMTLEETKDLDRAREIDDTMMPAVMRAMGFLKDE